MAVKQAKVESEYAKDTQLKPEDVELLKTWMGKQHHLPKISDLQEAVPIRLKNVHVINATSAFTKLLNLLKPFIKAELMNMIVFHENLESLFKYVPQKYLPKEYGGNAPCFQDLHTQMLESFKANDKFFADEELLVSDESKRVNKSEFAADQLFGMDGTFKKLSID